MCSLLWAMAQLPHLKIEGIGPNLYLTHKVAAKETLYSLSKLYNVPQQGIIILNGLAQTPTLQIDQQLRIPLMETNFVQNGQMADDEALIPLYHTVAAGENLYRVSINFNKVKPDVIKEWNNLSKDIVLVGQDIIVGHLLVKKDKLAYFKTGTTIPASQPDAAMQTGPANTTTVTANPQPPLTQASAKDKDEEGYFAQFFSSAGENKTEQYKSGTAATFKSTSGWADKKYYILIDSVAEGTIVRVSVGGKAIYAKVLGAMPKMKDNEGLLLRLSNAAASVLGIIDARFSAGILYYN